MVPLLGQFIRFRNASDYMCLVVVVDLVVWIVFFVFVVEVVVVFLVIVVAALSFILNAMYTCVIVPHIVLISIVVKSVLLSPTAT